MSELKVNSIKGVAASTAAITINNTDGTCTATVSNIPGRNRIINGACTVAQRQTSAVTVSGDTYGVDRTYAYENTNGAITVEQSTESPDNFVNSLKATVTTADTSLAAGQYVYVAQAIEGNNVADIGWGTSAAKRVALSFYVKSSVTGTFSGSMKTDSNTNYPFTYTIANTNWNRYTINVPPVTTGTMATNTSAGVRIYWSLGVGSDYQGSAGSWTTSGGTKIGASGETALIGTNSATFHITGIQFEVSDNGIATDFEHRSYSDELSRCHRYFHMIVDPSTDTYSDDKGRQPFMQGLVWNKDTKDCRFRGTFNVPMRASPSLYKVVGTAWFRIQVVGGVNTTSDWTLLGSWKEFFELKCTAIDSFGSDDAGMSIYAVCFNSGARVGWSAEL